MQINRRGFLASLIAAPVLAKIAGVEVAARPQWCAYLYSNENLPVYPLLTANVYGVGRPLTEKMLVDYFDKTRELHMERWRRSLYYGYGQRWDI